MKKLLVVFILLVSGTLLFAQDLNKKEKKAHQKAEQMLKTKLLVESNAWQFDANQMIPASGKSKILTTPYNIVVKDREVDSYLPYFGRAYRADYGSTESPLIFKGDISDYKVESGKKKGWYISFKTNKRDDVMKYYLHVAENGSASLSINSTNRQTITFHGNLVDLEEKR